MLDLKKHITSQISDIIKSQFPEKTASIDIREMNNLKLQEDISLSSLDIIILFAKLENQFNIDLFDEISLENDEYKNISSLANIIYNKIKNVRK